MDDYTAPLGFRPPPSRRRPPRLGRLALVLCVLLVAFAGTWAVVNRNSAGGEPQLVVALPKVPAELPAAPAPAATAAPELPEANGGQIVIRDP